MSTPAQVAADLIQLEAVANVAVHKAVVHYGALLQASVRRRASLPRTGPPGPRLQTGAYVKSINRRTTRLAHTSIVEVGSNAPQARRLEHGFSGVDSLGRHYDQPPYPHYAPALAEIRPAFEAAIAAIGVPKR